MEILRNGTSPSQRGGADRFTGEVRVDRLNVEGPPPDHATVAFVRFEPGARTAWHTHSRGQLLVVTAGTGRVQRKGATVEEIHPGDAVWFSPGEVHWHGAAPEDSMTHLTIQEPAERNAVEWLELVSDDEYNQLS
jgi:quercetin dioxygenase-like cupin family protein